MEIDEETRERERERKRKRETERDRERERERERQRETEREREERERVASLNPLFLPNFDAAERKGVECVRRALDQLGGEVIAGSEPVFDAGDEGKDTFVDVVSGE